MGRMSPVNLTEAEQQHFYTCRMADYLQLGDFWFLAARGGENSFDCRICCTARWLSGSEYLRAESGLE